MKTLTRSFLVVILLFAHISSFNFATAGQETIFPYEFKEGVVNIIQYSDNPATPLWTFFENNYPSNHSSYTVNYDGWLEIFVEPVNGTRPMIFLNDQRVYDQKNPFYSHQVFAGEKIVFSLTPPENLIYTNSIVTNQDILTVYETYGWETMIGDIIFDETPRQEINSNITWTQHTLIEPTSLTLFASNLRNYQSWEWTLSGSDLLITDLNDHFITPQLEAGTYNVSLDILDTFGYSKTINTSFVIKPTIKTLLSNPNLTNLEILDVYSPNSIVQNSLLDIDVALSYSTPIPRDIRLLIKDLQTGETLAHIEDHVSNQGTKQYTLSFISTEETSEFEVTTQFQHDSKWIDSPSSKKVSLITFPPITENKIPGFSPILVVLALLVSAKIIKGSSHSVLEDTCH